MARFYHTTFVKRKELILLNFNTTQNVCVQKSIMMEPATASLRKHLFGTLAKNSAGTSD